MRKEFLLPALALGGGLAGLALRLWELSSAFEADTGLPVAGAPATLVLAGFSAAVLLALVLLCRGTGRGFQGSYDEAFQAAGSTPYLTVMVAAAFLMAGSGVLLLAQAASLLSQTSTLWAQAHSALAASPGAAQAAGAREALSAFLSHLLSVGRELLLAILALASAASLFLLGKNNYKGEGKGERSGCLLTPAYTACVWLIVSYLDHSGDPIVLDYVYQLFAVVAAVLGSYFLAGFGYQRPKGFPAAFFSLAAMYFCLVTLADRHTPAELLLYVGYFLYFAGSVHVLLAHLARPLGPRMPGGKRLAHTEKPLNQEETPDEG